MKWIAWVVGLWLAACGGGAAAGGAQPSSPGSAGTSAGAGEAAATSGAPVDLDCGDFSTCALTDGGGVRCWGRDRDGELGDGGGEDQAKPVPVAGVSRATALALASQFACALLADKTVSCWGTGKLGEAGPRERARPGVLGGIGGVDELAASGLVACARSGAGIRCWGGEVGAPPGGAFSHVSAGFSHACALDQAGTPLCWGKGDWAPAGAFGKPPLKEVVALATGDRHACAITKEKKVVCWGANDAGQLGTAPALEPVKKPVAVPGVAGVTQLVAGEASTCALHEDGTVTCWGANGEGELGLGRESNDERPSKLGGLTDVRRVCLATAHGCALTGAGKILCWGSNSFGQLGDGTKERRFTPAAVAW